MTTKILTDGFNQYRCRIVDEIPEAQGFDLAFLSSDQIIETEYLKSACDIHNAENAYDIYKVTILEGNTVDEADILENGWKHYSEDFYYAIEDDIHEKWIEEMLWNHREEIADKIRELYRDILEKDGRVEYKMYMDSDGDTWAEEFAQGDRATVNTADDYLFTIESPNYDWKEICTDEIPDDDPEEEARLREETNDYVMESFDPYEIIDSYGEH